MPRESDATKISPKTDALVGAAGTKDVQNGLANAQLHFTKYRQAIIIFPIFLNITLSVGDGDTGVGGDVNINAGKSIADDGTTGGMIVLHAGESTLTSSGKTIYRSKCWYYWCKWYDRYIGSGTSSAGVTGSISMTSGKSTGGKGGTITLSVGDGDTGVGGDVNINAGKTSASNTQGGAVCYQVEPVHKGLVVKYHCLLSMVVYRVIWR